MRDLVPPQDPLDPGLAALPPDPTLPPRAYERMALLLRFGVLASGLMLGGGLIVYLLQHPSETFTGILSVNPIQNYLNGGTLFSALASGRPEAWMTLGILVLIAATVGRVALAARYFFAGRERALGAVTLTVAILLLVALFVVGPSVP